MKTKHLVAFCLSALLLIPSGLMAAGPQAPAEVMQAAAQGLKPFLAKIQADSMERFGLDADAPLDSATLGAPFLLHTIAPAALAGYKTGMAVSELITPTSMWYFPVLINGEARLILVVDRMGDKWEAVSLGYPPLALEWANVKRQWPEERGYNPVLVAVFQARQHLFTVPEKGASNLTPLVQGRQAAPNAARRYSSLGDADSAIQSLIPVVERNMRD